MASAVPPRRMPSSLVTVPPAWAPGRSRVVPALVLRGGGPLVRGEAVLVQLGTDRCQSSRPSPRRCPGSAARRRSGPRSSRPNGQAWARRNPSAPAHRLHHQPRPHRLPRNDPGRGGVRACWDEPTGGQRSRPARNLASPRRGPRCARVKGLPDLAHAGPDHVVHDRGIDPAALRERREHEGGQVHGMHPGQPTVRLPTGVRTAATITASRTEPSLRVAGTGARPGFSCCPHQANIPFRRI